MKIDIIIPTLNRKDKLLRCLGSLNQSMIGIEDNVYIYVYYSDLTDYQKDYQGLFQYKNILTRLLEKEYKAPNFWNDHLKESSADIYVYLNDDVAVHINFIRDIINKMEKKFPDLDGIVGIRQDNLPQDQTVKTAFGAIGTKFADRFPDRKVFCEDYYRFYIDKELELYSEKIDKLYFNKDALDQPSLIHFHPAFCKDEKDSTHDLVRKWIQKDKNMFAKRQEQNLLWGESFKLINDKPTSSKPRKTK